MCGFVFESSFSKLQDRNSFLALLSRSSKRGPDHQGYWTNNQNVQMGFNRLAILDLTEAGNQPMQSPQGRFMIVFNGEIYNHLELRKQLGARNYRGLSDTETVSVCLEEWGIERTVNALDGMFAIVIYDIKSNEIVLVRDFAGIKPLFYGWDGKCLVAASQYDQVACHPSFKDNLLDEGVLKLYLQQHYMPAPFGLVRNTYQVAPGEMILISSGGKRNTKLFWEFPSAYEPLIHEKQQALSFLEQELELAVERELLSDVPLGAFLSGGIDSPLIAYYARKKINELKTFTIGSDSLPHDESANAKKYSELIDTDHFSFIMKDSNSLNYLNDALACLHEPLADFSIIPTYVVSKLAREQVTVALSGDGGDELFFGYERFWSIAKNIRYQYYPWLVKAGLYKVDQWLTKNKNFNSVLLSESQGMAHQGLHSRFHDGWLFKIFPDLESVKIPESFRTYEYANSHSEMELIQSIRKAEFYGMMQKTLRKVDLASMENSLEVRVPFLKKTFIEASLKIDPMLSYGRGRKKQLLKDLLSKQFSGSPIDELKRGFTIPLSHWIRKDLKEPFNRYLHNKVFLSSFDIRSEHMDNLMNQQVKGEDLKWPIFTLTALSAWKQNVNV